MRGTGVATQSFGPDHCPLPMIDLAPATALLERSTEVAVLDAAIAAASNGTGRFVVIEGEAGIGKSTLLARAMEIGRERGLRVPRARATELERLYPWGVGRCS